MLRLALLLRHRRLMHGPQRLTCECDVAEQCRLRVG
jgi:hypothetical protein